MRLFEMIIGLLIVIVLGCFVALLVRVGPAWGDVFRSYLPNSGIIEAGGLYAAVGIIGAGQGSVLAISTDVRSGATVMPHALFLGSKLATIERYREDDDVPLADALAAANAHADASESRPYRARSRSNGPSLHLPNPRPMPALPMPAGVSDEEDTTGPRALKGVAAPSLDLIRRHVTHASWDIATSLMCFALVINSAILIVSATAFNQDDAGVADGDLFSAHALIGERLGTGACAVSLQVRVLQGV
jgi:metal iron transporter